MWNQNYILWPFSVHPLIRPTSCIYQTYIKVYRPPFYSQCFSFSVLQALHSVLLTCAFCCSPACCQCPVLSDWVLLDISHMDIVVFNIRCAHLKTVGVAQDFQSSRVIKNVLRSTILKNSSYSKKYSNCNTWFRHNSSVFPTIKLYDTFTIMTLHIPSSWERMYGLRSAQAHW